MWLIWKSIHLRNNRDMPIKSIEEITEAKEQSRIKLKALYQMITDLAEQIVPIYDVIENYFFQDVDYQKLKYLIPTWMVEAGQSPESLMTKGEYEQARLIYNDSLSNRIIHWADVQILLTALQDRVMAVNNYLLEIYHYLPSYCLYDDCDYKSSTREMNDTSDKVHTAANNVFVSLCSSFDLFTKIVYECAQYNIEEFDKYKGNYGFEELKVEGLLYSEPVCIRTFCSFRDEFIHNGAWDYRCAIYYPIVDGVLIEPFVLMPDFDENGILVSSGSRNKFYTRSKKLNVELPGLVKDVILVLANTLTAFKDILINRTDGNDKGVATREAIKILMRNYELFIKAIIGDDIVTSKE